MNTLVDNYFNKIDKWQQELTILREILIDCDLVETLKWGVPCYTYNTKNIILINRFKDYCVISFVKGALLIDANNILIQQTENSQSVRIIKFYNSKEILELKPLLISYIKESIDKSNLKIELKSNKELEFVAELHAKLDADISFKTAFEALTPGRQRAYNLYFSDAKQSKTRESRIESYTSRILSGKGFNDCVCGLSKRMPNCDGSHKWLDKTNPLNEI